MSELTRRFEAVHVLIPREEQWSSEELDILFKSIMLFAGVLGGEAALTQRIGGLRIERTDIGSHLGLAYRDRIELSEKDPLTAWSVVHELAHVCDARQGWTLSLRLQNATGGFTSRLYSFINRFIPGRWDAGRRGAEQIPGRYGRKPGCNAFGYFYGDKPSGANWRFNRKEDFAESMVMYCGWGRDNELSRTAHGRIERYLLPNGSRDPIYGITENWSDYARYFYPPDGDYTKTRRWEFIDRILHDY
ncbi:MAG: hypothetical protein FJZ87_10410 [Chloroflexi bacterium]|nr:hypothetical protein [Chloroflexota bacterium]